MNKCFKNRVLILGVLLQKGNYVGVVPAAGWSQTCWAETMGSCVFSCIDFTKNVFCVSKVMMGM